MGIEAPISHGRDEYNFGWMNRLIMAPAREMVPANNFTTVTIGMETLQPIREDKEYNVRLHLRDESGTAEDPNQYPEFTIDAAGFSPRTIEEF